jgi:hypothetical protein
MAGNAMNGLMRKIACQAMWSTIQPPSSGPMAAAIAENPAHVPMALPRSVSGNDAPMIASEHGMRSAAPMPCSARAMINWVTFGESPHQTDAQRFSANSVTKRKRWRLVAE